MRKIIHVDMDAFFASVEQRDRPELRGKPLLVGGSPKRRGVVSTCSYEARAFGVHSGMPTATALRKCPQAELLVPDFRKYCAVSRQVRELFSQVTDLVEVVSIDEAYLDVTENRLDLGSAVEVAQWLRRKIRETTGLTASAGVSFNKFLAKVASDYRKPDGLTEITLEEAPAFLENLPIRKFHGIGSASAARLESRNIRTGRDLKQLSLATLQGMFGKAGEFYYRIVRCEDDRPVEPAGEPKSISREHTLDRDCKDLRTLRILLKSLSLKVFRMGERRGVRGRSVTVKIKYDDFHTVTRSAALPVPVTDGVRLGAIAVRLAARAEWGSRPVRLVGVGIGALVPADDPTYEQQEFDFVSKLRRSRSGTLR